MDEGEGGGDGRFEAEHAMSEGTKNEAGGAELIAVGVAPAALWTEGEGDAAAV
jgi:hypothetical protein